MTVWYWTTAMRVSIRFGVTYCKRGSADPLPEEGVQGRPTLEEEEIENCRGRISGKRSRMYSTGTFALLNSAKTSAIVRFGRFA